LNNPKTIRANGAEMRRRMHRLGVSGVELARKAKVAEGTIAHALHGRRLQPSTFRAIAKALADLAELEAIPGVDGLIDPDGQDGRDGREAADG
jgi:transcriptional regulator with XRE-family HTH domain